MNQNDTIKEAALVVNGEFPKKPSIIEKIKESKVIIATDGAANLLSEHEIHPHYVIGDLDSINNDNDYNVIETPDQSKTDLEKALDWCIDNNYLKLSIFGMSGNCLLYTSPSPRD